MNPVAAFEKAFAEYVGASYAIALCNGTATLHTALAALGVQRGDVVKTTPLTMSATSIAILHAGVTPCFVDVDPATWLVVGPAAIGVSLYGLHAPTGDDWLVDDAAQTLRQHNPDVAFTSYSFQASKILPLGEGGMLVTNREELARRAREFSSLGYRMSADQPRIHSAVLKDPDYARHWSLGWNYRMSELVALQAIKHRPLAETVDSELAWRAKFAALYRQAIDGCSWLTPQHVPDGWGHSYWSYAVALESADLWHPFVEAIERHGGERPYAAWRLTYQEPAFRHLAEDGTCPVAEDLQPRLVQFQTNMHQCHANADAVHAAIRELEGAAA